MSNNNNEYPIDDKLWDLVKPRDLDKPIDPVRMPFFKGKKKKQDGEAEPEAEESTKKSKKQRTERIKLKLNVIYSLARISVGNMIVTAGCRVQVVTRESTTWLLLSYDSTVPMEGTVEHRTNLSDESVQVMKYFSNTSDGKEAKNTVVIEDETQQQVCFVAMKVIPNETNGFDRLSKFYDPEAEEGDQETSLKKYVAMEFRSDEDIHAFLKTLRGNETLSAYLTPESVLSDKNKAEYGATLLKAAKDDYQKRKKSLESSVNSHSTPGKPFLKYPFGGDPVKINHAAYGLQIASRLPVGVSNMASSLGHDPNSNDAEAVERSTSRAETVIQADIERLDNHQYLNDTLVNFWMKWITRCENKTDSPLHIFTSHFYTTLVEEDAETVAHWTANRNIDILSKKMIFLPINGSLHWSLCVIVNPGAILNRKSVHLEEISKDVIIEQLGKREDGSIH